MRSTGSTSHYLIEAHAYLGVAGLQVRSPLPGDCKGGTQGPRRIASSSSPSSSPPRRPRWLRSRPRRLRLLQLRQELSGLSRRAHVGLAGAVRCVAVRCGTRRRRNPNTARIHTHIHPSDKTELDFEHPIPTHPIRSDPIRLEHRFRANPVESSLRSWETNAQDKARQNEPRQGHARELALAHLDF